MNQISSSEMISIVWFQWWCLSIKIFSVLTDLENWKTEKKKKTEKLQGDCLKDHIKKHVKLSKKGLLLFTESQSYTLILLDLEKYSTANQDMTVVKKWCMRKKW